MTISIEESINKLMIEGFEIPEDKLLRSAKLYEDLGLDSLDAVDMLVHLEQSLGVKVAGERFMHVRSLGDVYDVVTEVVAEHKQQATNITTVQGEIGTSKDSQI